MAVLGAVSAVIMAAPFVRAQPAPTVQSEQARQATEHLVDRALAILRDRSSTLTEKRQRLKTLAQGDFAFPEMARDAMGTDWGTLSTQQRADYSRLFTAFIEDAYLSKIQEYSGQNIRFVSTRAMGAGRAEVSTTVTKPGQQPIGLDFLLMRNPRGWQIYDLVIGNISVIRNYRTQFADVMQSQGFDKLMAVMREKQRQLYAELGSK